MIGIGSNIDAESNLRRCVMMIKTVWPAVRFSSIYQSRAREVTMQDDFLNAVALIETDEDISLVHRRLIHIEEKLHKAPPYRFGPRTIDLDLLLIDGEVIESDTLSVPHPRMHERRFVLQPLCDLIDPHKQHPVLKERWVDLLEKTQDQECERTPITL